MLKRTKTAMAAAFMGWMATSIAHATRYYVHPTSGSDSNTGTSWAQAFRTLRHALGEAAGGGDEIWVAQGTYRPVDPNNPVQDRGISFAIPANTLVYGGFRGVDNPSDPNDLGESLLTQRNEAANETILDGNIGDPNDPTDNSYHVVRFNSGSASNTKLSGFTIRNGYADGKNENAWGGGVLALLTNEQPFSVALNRLVIQDNYSAEGGAGMYLHTKGEVPIASCRFLRNRAAGGDGGGLLVVSTYIDVRGCVFHDNEATAGVGGGAATRYAKFSNCTFHENRSLGGGSGLQIIGSFQVTPAVEIYNSIIWGNTPEPQYPPYPSGRA